MSDDFEPIDDTERELFRVLRARADAETRAVYADWLEQHGHEARARYLRAPAELIPLTSAIDARWRAAVAQAPVSRCTDRLGAGCDMAWDALERTGDDRVRDCARCAKPVHFCSTLEEAIDHGQRHECIAIDRAIVEGPLLAGYDEASGPDWVGDIAETAPPPQPKPPRALPPKAILLPTPEGLLSRVRRWFRR